jgi:hypothetical protein
VITEQFRYIDYGDDDCGASTTFTKTLHNMTNVKPKVITIQLAMDGLTMKSTHIGLKTYYAYDRSVLMIELVQSDQLRQRASYVKECQQDLLGETSLTNSNYRVVLESDNNVAGVYPKGKDGSIDPAESFSFVSEYLESLFNLRVAPICATKYAKMSGYELCHRRLGEFRSLPE